MSKERETPEPEHKEPEGSTISRRQVLRLLLSSAGGLVVGWEISHSGLKECRVRLGEEMAARGSCQADLAAAEARGRVERRLLEERITNAEENASSLREENKRLATSLQRITKERDAAREEAARATVLALQAQASAEIWRGTASNKPAEVLKGVRTLLESIPINFTDEAQGILKLNEKVLGTAFDSARRLIVPISEITEGLTTLYAPLIDIVDKITGVWLKIELQRGEKIMKVLADAIDWVEARTPPGKIRDFFQNLREILAASQAAVSTYSEIKGKEGYRPFSELLKIMKKKLEEIDNRLSKGPTEVIKQIEGPFLNALRSLEERVGKIRQNALDKLEEEVLVMVREQLERETLLATISDPIKFQNILEELERRGLPLTPQNVIAIAKELIEK